MAEEGTENTDELSGASRARVEPKKTGRPTKLTPELADKVVALIGAGMFLAEACAEVDISPSTLRDWRKKAADGDEVYQDFVERAEIALHRAEGRLEVIHYAMSSGRPVPAAMNVDLEVVSLHALQFRLERGGTRPFAELKKLEHSGPDGGPIPGARLVYLPQKDAIPEVPEPPDESES